MKQVQHIMDKNLVRKPTLFTSVVLTASVLFSVVLSGCVTQDYENDKTPVVQNQANRDDMAATRVSLGLGYLKMGNMPQAKQNLEKAKNFSPEMVQVYTAFAHYYETVGEHKLTVESFEKALSLKSDDADTLNNYGVYLCRQKQVDAAEKQFLKAIAVPTYVLVAKSYDNLSSCFLQNDAFDKAESYLNKAIAHNPSSASTLFQMVRLQYAMGDYKQAKAFIQRFEKVTRRFTSQSLALAYKVHFKLGQRRTANNYGAMLVKMYPQSWEAQQFLLNQLELIDADNLAKRYQLTKVSAKPEKSTKRIVKLSPKNPSSVAVVPDIEEIVHKAPIVVEEEVVSVSLPSTTISPTASSASINAALTTAVIETVNLPEPEPEPEPEPLIAAKSDNLESETDNIAEMSVEASNQSKRVVVLNAPIIEQAEEFKATIVDEKVVDISAINQADVNTGVNTGVNAGVNAGVTPSDAGEKDADIADINTAEVSKEFSIEDSKESIKKVSPEVSTEVNEEEISLANTEIYLVAKKPTPILEDTPKEVVENTVDTDVVIKEEPEPSKNEQPVKEDKKTKKFPKFHVVSPGDTLYNISVKYNIKIKALRRWNNISKNKKLYIKDIIFLENPKLVNQ